MPISDYQISRGGFPGNSLQEVKKTTGAVYMAAFGELTLIWVYAGLRIVHGLDNALREPLANNPDRADPRDAVAFPQRKGMTS
jgi:hypothetical protein